jgi:transposase
MRQPLKIPVPTAEELDALDRLYRTTHVVRLRTRAQIVLLAGEQRLAAPAIARVVREDEQTVRRWLKRYLAEGIEGLKDRPMPGAPGRVTAAYREQLLAAVRRRPRSLGQPYSLWTLRRLADYLAERTGVRVSYETVRRALAAAEIVLSRPQHTISSPDSEYQVKKRRSSRPVTASRWAMPSTMPTSST